MTIKIGDRIYLKNRESYKIREIRSRSDNVYVEIENDFGELRKYNLNKLGSLLFHDPEDIVRCQDLEYLIDHISYSKYSEIAKEESRRLESRRLKEARSLSLHRARTKLIESLYTELDQYDFKGFIHICNMDNLFSILKQGGIYCREITENSNLLKTDSRKVFIGRSIPKKFKKYVRFYYRDGLFRNRQYMDGCLPNPVILTLKKDSLLNYDAYLSNGNVYNNKTKILKLNSENLHEILNFNFKKIFGNGNFREKTGELLIAGFVGLKDIDHIIFREEEDLEFFRYYCKDIVRIPCEIIVNRDRFR